MRKGVLHYKPATGQWQKTSASTLNLSIMKNGTLGGEEFATLQTHEMAEFNGGTLLKIPSGLAA